MKKIVAQVMLVLVGCVGFLSQASQLVFASKYGECGYGDGPYQTGCTSTTTTSQGAAPACQSPIPGMKTPWLYAAKAQDSSSILLYFTEADDPIDHYTLQFGTSPGNYQFGSTNIGGRGSRTYLVSSLSPNTTYYFRVRGGNGCAPGNWSNEIEATTSTGSSSSTLQILDTSIEEDKPPSSPSPAASPGTIPSKSKPTLLDRYKLKITLKDKNQKPLAGVKIAIHSTVREAVTDAQGVAHFDAVEPGQHKVIISYEGEQTEQSLYLGGDTAELSLNITLETKPTNPLLLFAAAAGGALLATCVLGGIVFFVRRRKQ